MTKTLRILQRTADDSALVGGFIQGRPSGTQRVYGAEVRTFLAWVNKPVHQWQASDLRAYTDQCRRNRLKPATLHRKVVILRAFTAFLHRERELDADPFSLVDVPPCPPPAQARTLTQEQMKAFFAQMRGVSIAAIRDRAIFLLKAATGLRISEVRGLSVRDVGEAEETGWKSLRVVGKGQKERVVHVRPEVWSVVLEYLQRRTDFLDEASPLFVAVPRARPIKALAVDRRLSVSSIFGRFKRLAKKAELPSEFSPHCLRHFFACEADAGGASVEAIRLALGHANLGTTQRYLQRVRKGVNEAFVKLRLPKLA
jgi:site-specific recombinase XerD